MSHSLTCEMSQNNSSKYLILSTDDKLSLSACVLTRSIIIRPVPIHDNSTKSDKCLHIVDWFNFFFSDKMFCHLMHFCSKYLSVMKCVRMRQRQKWNVPKAPIGNNGHLFRVFKDRLPSRKILVSFKMIEDKDLIPDILPRSRYFQIENFNHLN